MAGVRLEELVIFVRDVPATAAFYTRVFGLERVPSAFKEEHGIILDAGDIRLAFQARNLSAVHGGELVTKLDADASPPPFELSFDVGDVDATYARAVELGAEDLEEPHDTDWGDRIAHFRDPNGVLIGLSRREGSAQRTSLV
jgi:catechol 2,3-dioxygenase-like lactoylglutathione lyase family enzyme